jgi:hypothetical protein
VATPLSSIAFLGFALSEIDNIAWIKMFYFSFTAGSRGTRNDINCWSVLYDLSIVICCDKLPCAFNNCVFWSCVFIFSFCFFFIVKDPQKQAGIPAVQGDSAQAAQHQPIGLHIAITAAAVMTAALGGAQTSIQSNQNGLQNQSALANDPLTLHLAKMSRSQLTEIISELKVNTGKS